MFALIAGLARGNNAARFASLPDMLMFPPDGLGWAGPLIHPTAVRLLSSILIVTSLTAAIGLFTRLSAWTAVIAAIYVLGVPQFYGKVDHYHFLIWFALILAASPCADVLSVDAIRRAWSGLSPPRKAASRYGVPLRIMWLLFGFIYFFPGLAKLAAGPEWVFSDNLRNQMWNKWHALDWLPTIRIDDGPEALLWLMAGGAVVFELSFIFALFSDRLRPYWVMMALVFHLMTYSFLRILFRSLLITYVVFVPWHRVFGWLGALLFKEEATVRYSADDVKASRLAGALSAVDVLGRVRWQAVESGSEQAGNISISVGDRSTRRYDVGWMLPLALMRRIPLAVVAIGVRVVSPTVVSRKGSAPTKRGAMRTAVAFGVAAGVLISGMTYSNGWPFAAYPTFAGIDVPLAARIDTYVGYETGHERVVDIPASIDWLSAGRYDGLRRNILADPKNRDNRLLALWEVVSTESPELGKGATTLRSEASIYSTDPANRGDPPETSFELIAARLD